MDPAIRKAHDRYGKVADRVETGFVIFVGLLIAATIWAAFMVILSRHIARGMGSEVGD